MLSHLLRLASLVTIFAVASSAPVVAFGSCPSSCTYDVCDPSPSLCPLIHLFECSENLPDPECEACEPDDYEPTCKEDETCATGMAIVCEADSTGGEH